MNSELDKLMAEHMACCEKANHFRLQAEEMEQRKIELTRQMLTIKMKQVFEPMINPQTKGN